MKSNLDIETGNSECYKDNPGNCETYGRLYDRETALTACPSGWRLPDDDDWQELLDFLGGEAVAGGKMKSTRTEPDTPPRWRSPNTGATNSSGWSGLPGGFIHSNGVHYDLGGIGLWWSSSDDRIPGIASRFGLLYTSGKVMKYDCEDASIFYKNSVRCIKD